MPKSPKISVIIPCYNVEKYISECLDSVCKQTLKEIEIICIDDCSTDNTVKKIQDYQKKDNRIVLIKSKKKSYASVVRNKGLDTATGEFIAFMDSDDFYPDNKVLSNLYNAAKREHVKICGGGLVYFKNNKITKAESFYSFKNNKKIQYIDYQHDYGFTRFIYDRKFLESNNIRFPDYMVQEDPVFFVKAMTKAKEFFALKQNVYCYRITDHDHMLKPEQIADTFVSTTWLLNFCKQHELYKLYVTVCKRFASRWFAEKAQLLINEKKDDGQKIISDLLKSIDYKIIYSADINFELPELYTKLVPEPFKISVIIPVYKVENYLEKSVKSVTSQTYKNLEIILVDDGSPDNCPQMCEKLAKTDSRILVVHKTNGGLSSARNAGLDVATGQYIYFLDSDDYIEPDTLEIMLNAMQKNYADIVIGWVKPFYTGTEKPTAFDGMVRYFNPADFNLGNSEKKLWAYDILKIPAVAWGKLYKKSIIDKYNLRFDEGLINEDEGFMWYYNTKIKSGVFVPNEFYNYLIRSDSIMGDKQRKGDKIGDVLIIVDHVHDHLIAHDLMKVYRTSFRIWANAMIKNARWFAQDFNNQQVLDECEKRYIKYNKCSFWERLLIDEECKFIERIFSIKHSRDGKYKVVRILGFKLKFKR